MGGCVFTLICDSVPVDISKRTNPEEKGLDWRTLDEIDTSLEYLFPDSPLPCPVEKKSQLPSEQQEFYIQWICNSLDIDKNCRSTHLLCILRHEESSEICMQAC